MKALNISRGTSNNGYSQDQDGLLDGAVSILEQMKILNGSRGTNMEALAQAHVAKINELDENHAAGMQSKLWYTKNLEDRILEQDEEILQLKAREVSQHIGYYQQEADQGPRVQQRMALRIGLYVSLSKTRSSRSKQNSTK